MSINAILTRIYGKAADTKEAQEADAPSDDVRRLWDEDFALRQRHQWFREDLLAARLEWVERECWEGIRVYFCIIDYGLPCSQILWVRLP